MYHNVNTQRIEWDLAKNELNLSKHGVDFETAQLVFEDPCCISFIERVTDGEARWHAIGSIETSSSSSSFTLITNKGQMKWSASFPPVVRPGVKGNFMPKVSAEKRKSLQRLASRPDSEIDLTDNTEIQQIPSNAVIGKFYRPRKTTVTIRLDADVVAWIKSSGEGYQTRINAYLRQLMQQNR